jgi:dTDP-4-amino-4,6-dideoxygalactose transaminase
VEPDGFKCSWYLYTVRLKNAEKAKRDRLVDELRKKGIGAFVCYVNPIHLMPYYQKFGRLGLPVTEHASEHVFSLPVHPGVTPRQIDFIGETVLALLG